MIKIKVPASTANLSVGFDTLGMAVNIYNEYIFEISDNDDVSSFDIEYQTNNLVLNSYKYIFNKLKLNYIPIKISLSKSDVPLSRGLGSSSCCIVAGVLAACYYLKLNLSKEELITLASEIEGHPDNVAPAILGGLCASFKYDDKIKSVNYKISSSLKFYSLIPSFELRTEVSRNVLPDNYSKKDIVSNFGRLACIPYAFENGNLELIKLCFNDKIHEPYRFKIIENASNLKEYFKDYPLCISGAGPSLLLITNKEINLKEIYNYQIKEVKPALEGAKIYEI